MRIRGKRSRKRITRNQNRNPLTYQKSSFSMQKG